MTRPLAWEESLWSSEIFEAIVEDTQKVYGNQLKVGRPPSWEERLEYLKVTWQHIEDKHHDRSWSVCFPWIFAVPLIQYLINWLKRSQLCLGFEKLHHGSIVLKSIRWFIRYIHSQWQNTRAYFHHQGFSSSHTRHTGSLWLTTLGVILWSSSQRASDPQKYDTPVIPWCVARLGDFYRKINQ